MTYVPSIMMAIIGLLVNTSILVTIIKYRNSKTTSLIYWYVGSLAFYDILLLIVYWPVQLVKYSVSWPLGKFLCYFVNIFPILFGSGAALTIIAIAVDRYRVILKSGNPNPSLLIKIFNLAIILIISVGLTFPDIFFTSEKQSFTVLPGLSRVQYYQICIVDIHFQNVSTSLTWVIYIMYRYNIMCFIPFVSVLLIYYRVKDRAIQLLMATKLRKLRLYHKKNYKLLKMSLALMIVHFFSMTPEHIYYYIMISSSSLFDMSRFNTNLHVYLICQFLLLSKCLFNPIIYAYFIPECRYLLVYVGFRGKISNIPEESFINVPNNFTADSKSTVDKINLERKVSQSKIVVLSLESNV